MVREDEERIAYGFLESGDFDSARDKFGSILEKDPDNPEFECGFFASSYWLNREDLVMETRSGRSRGTLLVREWDQFADRSQAKGYPGLRSFHSCMKAILGRAAAEFRIAFQEEGGSSVDLELLTQLAGLLIKTEDYANAVDILQFAKRVSRPGASIYFMLGEAMLNLNDTEWLETGLSNYRDAFFMNPSEIDPALIGSDLASDVFRSLHDQHGENLELILEWMPAWMMIHSMVPGLRKLHREELEQILWETSRLEKERTRVEAKFQEKVKARLSFYYLTIIHHYSFHDRDPDAITEFEDRLKGLSPELHTRYREKKRK